MFETIMLNGYKIALRQSHHLRERLVLPLRWWAGVAAAVLPGARWSRALERLLVVVRALFSLCAPVRLLERLFHTCARVWRALQYSGYFIVDLQNFDKNSVLIFCFAIFCVPQVEKAGNFRFMILDIALGLKKTTKNSSITYFFTLFDNLKVNF